MYIIMYIMFIICVSKSIRVSADKPTGKLFSLRAYCTFYNRTHYTAHFTVKL